MAGFVYQVWNKYEPVSGLFDSWDKADSWASADYYFGSAYREGIVTVVKMEVA